MQHREGAAKEKLALLNREEQYIIMSFYTKYISIYRRFSTIAIGLGSGISLTNENSLYYNKPIWQNITMDKIVKRTIGQ